jgi:hypothetical protein
MPDSGFIFSPAQRLTSDDLAALNGGYIEVYAAGTSTPQAVYSDAALTSSLGSTVYLDSSGNPVASQGSSTKVTVYTGAAKVKLIIKTSAGVTVQTIDNLQCAQDTSLLSSGGSGSGITGVTSKSANFSIATSDNGQWFSVDPTSGAVVATLPSAVTAGNGFAIGIIHAGASTTNRVRYQTVSSQTIAINNASITSGTLTAYMHSVWLVSDGANWRAIGQLPPGIYGDVPKFRVASRLTAPPTSPTSGARYIINGSPTGAWASYAQHDVVEADGLGGWTRITPPINCGWLAYIEAEQTYTAFKASAWVDQSGMSAPQSSNLKTMVLTHTAASGTAAPASTATAWTKRTLNTTNENSITGASVASSVVTLPTGEYLIRGWQQFDNSASASAGAAKVRLRNTTTSTSYDGFGSDVHSDGSNYSNSPSIPVFARVTVAAATENFELQYYTNSSSVALGNVQSIAGVSEVWAGLEIISLSSLQGPQGIQGIQGNPGADGADAGWKYTWSSNTSATDPTSGGVKANNATLGSITAIYISETDADANGLASEIATWGSSSSATKSTIKIGNASGMVLFKVTSLTDNGTWVTLTGTVTGSRGSLSGTVRVAPAQTGDKGDTGATGATGSAGPTGATGATGPNTGLDYAWDTGTTDANPGSGNLRVNNATLGSASFAYISKTDRPGNSQGTNIDQWDASNNTAHLGTLRVFDVATRTKGFTAEVTTAFTDGTTYWKIPLNSISVLSGGAPAASDVLAVMWSRTGNKGSDGAGSFTSLSPGAGLTSNVGAAAPGSAITTSGTLSAAALVNAQTGTTYTMVDGDRAKLVTFANAAAVAVTLPQAGASTAFQSGWFCDVLNAGSTTVTITPTTSTINGAATFILNRNQSARIYSDGTNYQVFQGMSIRASVSTVSSASTCDIGAVASHRVSVTGTTTITSFGTVPHVLRFVTFAGALTLTHNATTLILPGGANITTAAGDAAVFMSDASGNWTCISYSRASGKPIIPSAFSELTAQAAGLAAAPFGPFTSLASASTADLSSVATVGVNITGTTTITSFGTGENLLRILRFAGALTLTHNATSLILPNNGSNITTAANDRLIALSDGSGNWTVVVYERASGAPLSSNVALLNASQSWTAQQTSTIATLTDAANISWDVSAAQKAQVTLAGNRTVNAVSNAVAGTTYLLWVIQDATGSRTLTWTTSGAGSFDFGTDGAPTLTTTASRADLLAFEAISIGGTLKLRFAGIKKGFS